MANVEGRLTAEQADRAIYIDFEGMPKETPALLGVACEGKWQAKLFEDSLWPAARFGVQGGTVVAADFTTTMDQLHIRAERENRVICAWSPHELDVLQDELAHRTWLLEWFENHLINIKPQTKKFLNSRRIEVEPIINRRTGRVSRGHQAKVMKALDIHVPEEFGRGVAAKGISSTRAAIERRETFARVTPAEKRKWRALLLHNRYDCIGMAAIMRQVTRGVGHRLPASMWTLDPTTEKPVIRRNLELQLVEPVPRTMALFVSSWMNRKFFFGPILTTDGWAIAGFSAFDTGFQQIIPYETKPTLLEACERAAIENLKLGLEPQRTWHPDDLENPSE